MKNNTIKLVVGTSLTALMASEAFAGGFAVREQSAYGQGASFAGIAAPGDSLSSMFWNPSAITQFDGDKRGITFESVASGIFPNSDAEITAGPGAAFLSGLGADISGSDDNVGLNAFVPATYAAYKVNENVYLGLSINSPLGLGTKSDAGSLQALTSSTFQALSINAAPTVGYKFSDRFAVAAGVQVQYFDARQNTSIGTELEGDDFQFGFTLGATIKPTDTTTIGIGYRSRTDVKLDGTFEVAAGSVAAGLGRVSSNVTAEIATPDIVTVGLRQDIGEKFTLLAGLEWANWSRLKEVDVLPDGSTTPVANFEFHYDDSWLIALGGEYDVTDALTVRGGVAFETSPTNGNDRSLSLPDNDRWWFSAGGTYKPNDRMAFDLGYSYIAVREGAISSELSNGASVYSGTADGDVHIFAAGARIKF